MGATDKISGRIKQAVGDLTGNEATRRKGLQQEREADAEEEAARAQTAAEEKRAEANRLKNQPGAGGSDPSPRT
jgi:uncharacterized protein YjbJ (UPF0337 family)